MSKQVRWEYKVRVVDGPMVNNEWLLGQTEESRQGAIGPIEVGINELARDDWDLMPIAMQPGAGKTVLVFRRPARGEGVGFARL